ncbi:hypothetical protein KSP39_PZI007466 [Platanthera zijinensis]|uniref:Uncharacterized protein n=1 Tax=Platanthera zijinensis TaxID=2320716 RepID=A0AAP0BQP0_9ASPA
MTSQTGNLTLGLRSYRLEIEMRPSGDQAMISHRVEKRLRCRRRDPTAGDDHRTPEPRIEFVHFNITERWRWSRNNAALQKRTLSSPIPPRLSCLSLSLLFLYPPLAAACELAVLIQDPSMASIAGAGVSIAVRPASYRKRQVSLLRFVFRRVSNDLRVRPVFLISFCFCYCLFL